MLTEKLPKVAPEYYCECCDFGVFVKSMMDTHLNTNKHQLKFNDSQNINI